MTIRALIIRMIAGVTALSAGQLAGLEGKPVGSGGGGIPQTVDRLQDCGERGAVEMQTPCPTLSEAVATLTDYDDHGGVEIFTNGLVVLRMANRVKATDGRCVVSPGAGVVLFAPGWTEREASTNGEPRLQVALEDVEFALIWTDRTEGSGLLAVQSTFAPAPLSLELHLVRPSTVFGIPWMVAPRPRGIETCISDWSEGTVCRSSPACVDELPGTPCATAMPLLPDYEWCVVTYGVCRTFDVCSFHPFHRCLECAGPIEYVRCVEVLPQAAPSSRVDRSEQARRVYNLHQGAAWTE